MIIKSLHIKNFRSIRNEKIVLKDITVFVGKNDAGKSNYLKALNLFFNNQTDFGTNFHFETDFCKSATVGQKMAKEIIIAVEFCPPPTFSNEENVLWTKVWRKDGEFPDKERIVLVSKKDMPARSRVPTWLSKLKFRYVPAVKSDHYFQYLLGDLSDSFADSVGREIHVAAKEFIGKIQENTTEISSELLSRLDISSNLTLPQDLRVMFETLEFNTKFGELDLSLKNRGDGIKTRHIPVILKFLAEQDEKTRTQGTTRVDTIWGFEEPENNLELARAFDLARDFYDYSEKIQIFITTHSPAFYNLKNLNTVCPNLRDFDSEKIATYYIDKDKHDNLCSQATDAGDEDDLVNEKIGLLPLITPHIAKHVAKENKLSLRCAALEKELHEAKKTVIITEGKSDAIILRKAWEALFDTREMPYMIVSCGTTPDGENAETAGASILKMALEANRPSSKVIGIFDYDFEGYKQYDKLSRNFGDSLTILEHQVKVHNNQSCVAFCLPLVPGRERYYELKILTLEHYFADEYLRENTDSGEGLLLEPMEIINTQKVIGTGHIISENRTRDGSCFVIKDGKIVFAEQVVPSFDKLAFENFRQLFDMIDTICSTLGWHNT